MDYAVLHEHDYTKYKKLAIWFGNEGIGISKTAVERSNICINIPMYGIIESLNLGTSSGIILYEIAKQRREFQFNLKNKVSANRDRKKFFNSINYSSILSFNTNLPKLIYDISKNKLSLRNHFFVVVLILQL